jgi:hypothetical protein
MVLTKEGGSESESEDWYGAVCLVLLLVGGGEEAVEGGRDDNSERGVSDRGVSARARLLVVSGVVLEGRRDRLVLCVRTWGKGKDWLRAAELITGFIYTKDGAICVRLDKTLGIGDGY